MKEVLEGELITTEGKDLVPLVEKPTAMVNMGDLSTPEKMEAALTHMQNAMDFKARVLEMAIKTATSKEIDNLGGKPYVTTSACMRILGMLGPDGGVRLVESVFVKDDEPDEDGLLHWGCRVTCKITHPVLGRVDGIGFAHTTDAFLGVNNRRSLAEVSKNNMQQHAFTRAKGHALREMLGLMKLEWEQLETWGFVRGKGANVSYKKPAPAKNPSRDRLQKFVKDRIFTTDQIKAVMAGLKIKGDKAMTLNESDTKKLIAELDVRAAEMEKE